MNLLGLMPQSEYCIYSGINMLIRFSYKRDHFIKFDNKIPPVLRL